MAKIECEVNYDESEYPAGAVMVTCGKCNHETMAYGTGENSLKRCLVMLKEECPRNESNNWYVAEDD